MSVEPDTPEDWITIRIQGRKADIGPDANVEDLFEKIRYLIGSKRLRVPGGSAARHKYTAERYGIVRKSDVGTDEDGSWKTPESKDDLVPYDLEGVEEGDELRAYRGPSSWEEPIYPDVSEE